MVWDVRIVTANQSSVDDDKVPVISSHSIARHDSNVWPYFRSTSFGFGEAWSGANGFINGVWELWNILELKPRPVHDNLEGNHNKLRHNIVELRLMMAVYWNADLRCSCWACDRKINVCKLWLHEYSFIELQRLHFLRPKNLILTGSIN